MKTKSINILNLCVPCYSHCKYCLLTWDGQCSGIDYERSVQYAKGFYKWLKDNHANIDFVYYFGYSMEHPKLLDAIKFMQETNSPGGEFLQFNGMKMRSKEEIKGFLHELKDIGIKKLDFTFYGLQKAHDIFAGRKGDFDLMIDSLDTALKIGFDIEIGIPVLKSNLNELGELLSVFKNKKIKVFLFTPHSGGRGKLLLDQKITLNDYNKLDDEIRIYFNRETNRTPQEWLCNLPKECENRALTLSLLPTNIDQLEKQTYAQTFAELEIMDEEYYGKIPSFQELLKLYADVDDKHLYSKKDLYLLYRKKFIEENRLNVHEMGDERFSNSIRY